MQDIKGVGEKSPSSDQQRQTFRTPSWPPSAFNPRPRLRAAGNMHFLGVRVAEPDRAGDAERLFITFIVLSVGCGLLALYGAEPPYPSQVYPHEGCSSRDTSPEPDVAPCSISRKAKEVAGSQLAVIVTTVALA